jgi:pimeloyl-ACP methyl ester carboxylesterase
MVLPGRGTTFVREVAGPPGAPVLALLHGWTATAGLNWFGCFDSLGQHYRVVALDHRGHGRGIRSRRPFRLEDCADDVAAVADVLDVERFIAVGYSMGGPVSQLTWRRHPDRVAGLVECATARSFRGARRPDLTQLMVQTGMTTAAAALRLVPPSVRRGVVRAGINRRFADDRVRQWAMQEMGRNQPAALVEAAQALARYSSTAWIGGVAVPTAVVLTERDQLVAPARQQTLAASIPGARVFPVDGDHLVCATDPGKFVPALVAACRWVAGQAGRAGLP